MSVFRNPDYLRVRQYRDSRNLSARIDLHRRLSTHPRPWRQWLFDQMDLPPHRMHPGVGVRSRGPMEGEPRPIARPLEPHAHRPFHRHGERGTRSAPSRLGPGRGSIGGSLPTIRRGSCPPHALSSPGYPRRSGRDLPSAARGWMLLRSDERLGPHARGAGAAGQCRIDDRGPGSGPRAMEPAFGKNRPNDRQGRVFHDRQELGFVHGARTFSWRIG